MLSHAAFDIALAVYGLLGAGCWSYAWSRRMPIDASYRRLVIPEIDPSAELWLSNDYVGDI